MEPNAYTLAHLADEICRLEMAKVMLPPETELPEKYNAKLQDLKRKRDKMINAMGPEAIEILQMTRKIARLEMAKRSLPSSLMSELLPEGYGSRQRDLEERRLLLCIRIQKELDSRQGK